MTEEYAEVVSDAGSGAGPARPKQILYRVPRDVYVRVLAKYEAGEKINFKEYRRREDYLTTEAAQELTAEEVKRRYGSGFYIAELVFDRTPSDLVFINIPPRGEVVLPADRYGRGHYGQPPPHNARVGYARPGNHPRRPRRDGGSGDSLTREIISRLEKQHQAEVSRMEQHSRELREREEQHREEVRQLERKLDEERFKRLEEKISEAGARAEENPTPFDFKAVVGQAVVKAVERGDDDIANNLVGVLKQEDEADGSVWGFLRGVAGDVIELARENPRGALQFFTTAAQGLKGGAATPPAAPQPGAQQQPPQANTSPTQPAQMTDEQLLVALSQGIAAAVVGDVDPTPVAQQVRDILDERPHLRPAVEGMLQQPDEELLSTLAMAARVSFEGMGRKPLRWARDFRRALKAYGVGVETQPPASVANNGHRAAAAEELTQ